MVTVEKRVNRGLPLLLLLLLSSPPPLLFAVAGPCPEASARNRAATDGVTGEPSPTSDVPRSETLATAAGTRNTHFLGNAATPIATIEGDPMARSAATEETREIAHTRLTAAARAGPSVDPEAFPTARRGGSRPMLLSTLCGLTFWQTWPRRLCR